LRIVFGAKHEIGCNLSMLNKVFSTGLVILP
jgi:hypothetical protein